MDGAGFMQKNPGERVRIYLVVGLALILVALAYFRFFHKKPGRKQVPVPAVASTAYSDAPEIDIGQLQTTSNAKAIVQEPRRAFIRDIFAPLISVPGAVLHPIAQGSPKQLSSFKLRGVIVGGGGAIAMINDQLLRTGEWIGEYQVVRIEKKAVFLASDSERIELKLVQNE
jgi:hypothetical protein